MPLILLIQTIAYYTSPIFGLLGLWKFRIPLYNIIYSKVSTYSKENIVINSKYCKQIVLLGNDYDIAGCIWDYYRKNRLV